MQTTGKYILDEHGEPKEEPDLLTWALWLETADCRVAQEYFDWQQIRVSTIFLGFDHRLFAGGPPLLFETMIFGGRLDGERQRYSTRAEALLGHQALCALVQATRTPDPEGVG